MNTTTATRPATTARMPSFFNPANAAKWDYAPDIARVFDEAVQWRTGHSIKAAATDRKILTLVPIDMQGSFCFPEGSLFVGGRSGTGATDDNRRLVNWVYENLGYITTIAPTFDTHVAFQIFFRSFWQNADGTPIAAYTEISAQDIRNGTFQPSPMAAAILANGNVTWLREYTIHYCTELEKAGKYKLYIWPEHCLLGTWGHNLVGVLQEAMYFHAFARGSQPDIQIKGGNPFTENYSVMRPEVLTLHDGRPIPGAQKNTRFIDSLLRSDYTVLAGQAASHCVQSSIDDLLTEILAKDPALARKVYVMEDCMSAVTVPDGNGGFFVDYTPEAEAALKRFSDAGMHVVKSTTPIDQWPDLVL